MKNIIFFIEENIILVSVWFVVFILTIFCTVKNIFLKSKIINNIQAIKLINQDHAIVIDTRPPHFFKQGHIVNSINIPLKNIFSGNIKEIEIHKSSPVILILNEVNKNSKCIKEFSKYGFNHIYILKNGIYYWNLDHLPLITKDK